MTLSELGIRLSGWLDGSGPNSDIVLSSRVRLARNLASIPFAHCAKPEQRREVIERFERALKDSGYNDRGKFLESSHLSELDKEFLIERHLISPDFATKCDQRGLFIGQNEVISIMVNEEDHFRIQAIQSGFQLREALQLADEIDSLLSSHVDYAFSEQFGFLTACPTNTGTGMRASMLIHLPGLVLTNDINRVLKGIAQVGLVVRGFYGEGTDVLGYLFQVSNQTTLGRLEEEIIEDLERVTRQIIGYEREARRTLLRDARDQIEDKIWRAYGILRNARVLASEEVMNLLSALRLGLGLRILNSPSLSTINELLILSQPAHLQKYMNKVMEPIERDIVRARLVRERLMDDKESMKPLKSDDAKGKREED